MRSFEFTATTPAGEQPQRFEVRWEEKLVHHYTKNTGEDFPDLVEGSVVMFFANFPYVDFVICSKNYADPRMGTVPDSVPVELFMFQVSRSSLINHGSTDRVLQWPGNFKVEEGKRQENLAIFIGRKAGIVPASRIAPTLNRLPDHVHVVYVTTSTGNYPQVERAAPVLLVNRSNLLDTTNLVWDGLDALYEMLKDLDQKF